MLHAVFIPDDRPRYRGQFTGAQCKLPCGEVDEVRRKRTPFYDLCRKLDRRNLGDRRIQILTPKGTPSLRGKVSVLAGLIVSERDTKGLALEIYRPFPVRGVPKESDLAPEGRQTAEKAETRLSESPPGRKAA